MNTAQKLLSWFDRVRRDLPWRRTKDPYAVWISEVMLQQTRVETVVPYYRRFLESFPTVEALARASSDRVLAHWSGLGYYRRARQLHRAAQIIVRKGEFPASVEDLLELPGVGGYTASAIASIAFGIRTPAVDGNVERVISRLEAYDGPVKAMAGRRRLAERALQLLSADRPGDGNQALMELGATVCLPRKPRCLECPFESECRAFELGEPEAFPAKAKKRPQLKLRQVSVVVEDGGRVLLVKRSDQEEVLSGLWELPAAPWADDTELERELATRYGGRWALAASCGWVRHAITYRSFEVEVRRGRLLSSPTVEEKANVAGAGWFRPGEIVTLPTSSLVEKILAKLSADSVQSAAG